MSRRSRQGQRGSQPLKRVVAMCEAKWFLQDLQLATEGDAEAMVRVGHMLLAGYGTRQDPKEAAKWLRQAWAIQTLRDPGSMVDALDLEQAEVPALNDRQPARRAPAGSGGRGGSSSSRHAVARGGWGPEGGGVLGSVAAAARGNEECEVQQVGKLQQACQQAQQQQQRRRRRHCRQQVQAGQEPQAGQEQQLSEQQCLQGEPSLQGQQQQEPGRQQQEQGQQQLGQGQQQLGQPPPPQQQRVSHGHACMPPSCSANPVPTGEAPAPSAAGAPEGGRPSSHSQPGDLQQQARARHSPGLAATACAAPAAATHGAAAAARTAAGAGAVARRRAPATVLQLLTSALRVERSEAGGGASPLPRVQQLALQL